MFVTAWVAIARVPRYERASERGPAEAPSQNLGKRRLEIELAFHFTSLTRALTGKERVLLWTHKRLCRVNSQSTRKLAHFSVSALTDSKSTTSHLEEHRTEDSIERAISKARRGGQSPGYVQEMSGEKRPASFGSSQLVKRARPEANGNELATINGSSSGALIQGVSRRAYHAVPCDLQLKLRIQKCQR